MLVTISRVCEVIHLYVSKQEVEQESRYAVNHPETIQQSTEMCITNKVSGRKS